MTLRFDSRAQPGEGGGSLCSSDFPSDHSAAAASGIRGIGSPPQFAAQQRASGFNHLGVRQAMSGIAGNQITAWMAPGLAVVPMLRDILIFATTVTGRRALPRGDAQNLP